MKQLFLLLFVTMISLSVFSQTSKIVIAHNHLRSGELDKAKAAIDKAVVHHKTSQRSKAWFYKGDIYFAIFNSKNLNYKNLDPQAGQIAFEAYRKAKSLPGRLMQDSMDINRKLRLIQNIQLNRGISDYNNKNYNLAITKFKSAVSIAEHLGSIDTLALYNVALTSERNKQYNQAIAYYKKCMVIGYKAPDCCLFIVYILKKENKLAEAEEHIRSCRSKFPNNTALINSQINFNLRNKDYKSAKNNIKLAIKNNPTNPLLHYSLGTVLDKLNNPAEASTAYKEAIRFKPDYFEANYNLGALYFNQGVDINNKLSLDAPKKEYEAGRKQALNSFKTALPYLEKAQQLKPNDRGTLVSLRSIYMRLNNTKKYNEIKAILNK